MVRPAMSSDADVLADIHVASWQAAYRGLLDDRYLDGLNTAHRSQWFAGQLAAGATILVEPDEAPAGFCWFGEPFSPEPGAWGEVYAVYVHPRRWREGLGSVLLRGACSELASQGCSRVFLWVLDANERARRFYESAGWRLAGQLRLEEIGGRQVNEVRYERDLPAPPPPAPDRRDGSP